MNNKISILNGVLLAGMWLGIPLVHAANNAVPPTASAQAGAGTQAEQKSPGVTRRILTEEQARKLVADDQFRCLGCHAIKGDSALVGPSWHDVSLLYKNVKTYTYEGKTYPLVDGLVTAISKGRQQGHWGETNGPQFMPPEDPAGTKREDVEQLVLYILSLSD
jgi:cytochrome c551/c552